MTVTDDVLLKALRSQLGECIEHKKEGEYSYHCPFCNHYKKKLQVNLDKRKWHCWVCNARGRNLTSLFKKLEAPRELIMKVAAATKESQHEAVVTTTQRAIALPTNFKPLYISKTDPDYKNAINYLINKRGLQPVDILRYNIGYCDTGEYGGMIIIPSYDSDHNLNFFTGRSYYESSRVNHKNPNISKDLIGFEHLINWKLPVTIVEGGFDAIACGTNSIPLFGKIIPNKLKQTIISKGVQQVNIALDGDAKKQAIEAAEYFLNNGIDVRLVDLGDSDPSELGYEKMQELINNADPFTFGDLLTSKFSL